MTACPGQTHWCCRCSGVQLLTEAEWEYVARKPHNYKTGLGFLKNAAIDQHILRQNRRFDLIPVIEAHPELLGIGIDENTAIVVHGGEFEVIGVGYVAIVDHGQWSNSAAASPNKAAQKGKLYFLGKGDHFDLTK